MVRTIASTIMKERVMNITQGQAQELLGALEEMIALSKRHEVTGMAFIMAIDRAYVRADAAIAAVRQNGAQSHKSVTL